MPEQQHSPEPYTANANNPPVAWGVEHFLGYFAAAFVEAEPGTPEHVDAYRNLFLAVVTHATTEAGGMERIKAEELSAIFEVEITLVALARWGVRLPESATHPTQSMQGWRHEYRRVMAGLEVGPDVDLAGLSEIDFLVLLAEGKIKHRHDEQPETARKRNHRQPPPRRSVLQQKSAILPSNDASAA